MTRLQFLSSLLMLLLVTLMGCNDGRSLFVLGEDMEEQLTEGNNPCISLDKTDNPYDDIIKAVKQRTDAQEFLAWLDFLEQEDPKLFKDLQQNSFTLLVPSNEAVTAFKAAYKDVDLSGVNLSSLVKHHILFVPLYYRDIVSGEAPAANREPCPIRKDQDGCLYFGHNEARVIVADDICRNGTIQVVDAVLIPTKNFR